MAKVSLEELKKAVAALKESVEYCEDNQSNIKVYKIARDASIQRFEFCIELSWKHAKKVMGSSSGTPKPVIREMLQNGMIGSFEMWFDFIEARNKSSHTYDEEIAREVYNSAKSFCLEVDKLVDKMADL